MDNKAAVLCYGKLTLWDNRQDAIEYFREGAENSEGSEQERYLNIIDELMEGRTVCGDIPSPLPRAIDEHPLWTAACNGYNDKIIKFFNNADNRSSVNLRHSAFGSTHSLVMGALRNGNYETAKLLQQYGETIEPHECEEYMTIQQEREAKESECALERD